MDYVRTNVADRLSAVAAQMPEAVAVASANRRGYATCSFRELDDDASALARGLIDLGVKPGDRLVLLVKPGVEFVKLVYALLRTGAVTVLVDPGMGRKHLLNCLAAAEPEGFIAFSLVQAAIIPLRSRFERSKLRVTVGRRWFWGGFTYKQLLRRGRISDMVLPTSNADDAAAIIFTSGSTGPPKGVLYTHRMFETQVSEIQRAYDLQPGGVDLACFALFGLFNSAMGVTTVFPQMDFSRPASADPRKLLAAANEWQVTQAFASPAVWDKLGRHFEKTGERIPTLKKVFSCGAPVSATVLKRTLAMVHPNAEMHTPYGATEALPITTIEAHEVLGDTAAKTNEGAGVCVGRKFDSIEWKIIRISDEPIATMDDVEELPLGEIGELIVCGPQVSPGYVIDIQAPSPLRGGLGRGSAAGTRLDHPSLTLPLKGRGPDDLLAVNRLAKIRDGNTIWHRMGDVGYLDDHGRFWYCGRKSHRVETTNGTLFTECVEAVFNQHPHVRRSALVAVGPRDSKQPVLVVESSLPDLQALTGRLSRDKTRTWDTLVAELQALKTSATTGVEKFLLLYNLPVDVRHNSKINREAVAAWAMDIIADHYLWAAYGLKKPEKC
jgi:acyl-CoA synthetase (AMP-forming)/AMP-acid ligase II